jgi:hypothetical protein
MPQLGTLFFWSYTATRILSALASVRPTPGGLYAPSALLTVKVFHSKSGLCGDFLWVRSR